MENIENLKALVNGHKLNNYQRSLALNEFKYLLSEVPKLESRIKELEEQESVRICYQYLDKFKDIYDDVYYRCKKSNDPPDNVKLTIFYKSDKEEGFLINKTTKEASLKLLIAIKWILHSELEKLANKKIN